ncbi:MAG: glycosyltransferase [Desulfurococcales archaeon]|nr:glycosyltransferase [Desulfurococcales archaeon]
MMINSKITIVIPTYNPTRILLEVIEHLRRKMKTLPIIIVNDGSTQGLDILHEIENQYRDIIVVNLYENIGKAKAVRQVLENINSEYILLIDDDTIIDADEEKVYNLISENPETDLFLFKVRAYKPVKFIEKIQDMEYTISTYSIKKILGLPLGSIGPGALWRKDTLKRVLDLHDGTFAGDDLQMYLHATVSLGKQESIKYVPEVTLYTEPKHGFKDYLNQRVKVWIPGLMHNIRLFLPRLVTGKYTEGELIDTYRWIFAVKLYSVIIKFLAILMVYYTISNNYILISNIIKITSFILLIYLIYITIDNIIYLYKLLLIIGNGILITIIALELQSGVFIIIILIYIFLLFAYLLYYDNYNKKYLNINKIYNVICFVLFYFMYNLVVETAGILYYTTGRYK